MGRGRPHYSFYQRFVDPGTDPIWIRGLFWILVCVSISAYLAERYYSGRFNWILNFLGLHKYSSNYRRRAITDPSSITQTEFNNTESDAESIARLSLSDESKNRIANKDIIQKSSKEKFINSNGRPRQALDAIKEKEALELDLHRKREIMKRKREARVRPPRVIRIAEALERIRQRNQVHNNDNNDSNLTSLANHNDLSIQPVPDHEMDIEIEEREKLDQELNDRNATGVDADGNPIVHLEEEEDEISEEDSANEEVTDANDDAVENHHDQDETGEGSGDNNFKENGKSPIKQKTPVNSEDGGNGGGNDDMTLRSRTNLQGSGDAVMVD